MKKLVRKQKEGSLGTRLLRKFFFCLNQLILLIQIDLDQWASKWKGQLEKKHTSFLLFYFWDLESVSIDSALICILHRFLHEHIKLIFLRKCYQGKQPNSKIWVKYFLKCPYLICSHKTRKCWKQNIFHKNLAKNRVDEIVFVKFWF